MTALVLVLIAVTILLLAVTLAVFLLVITRQLAGPPREETDHASPETYGGRKRAGFWASAFAGKARGRTGMPKYLKYRVPGYCHCGAPCGPTHRKCAKCRAKSRWYRRKAWRSNQGQVFKRRLTEGMSPCLSRFRSCS